MMRVPGWIALAGLLVAAPAVAAAAPEPVKPLFAGNAMITVTVRGPINRITRDRADPSEPFDASLAVTGTAAETLPIKLKVRGITRRQRDICQFPPLRVEFVQKPPATSLFSGQKKLKLVTHCRSSAAFQKHVLLEYAAYRLFNLVTPLSFGVRLATVDYVDEDGELLKSRLGFFIEDVDDVARRNGMREAKTGDRVAVASLSARDAARVAVFEYMIGNLDWALNAGPPGSGCCHNSRLLSAEGTTAGFVPVPYDFDFSGLVDAPYALPPDGIPVRNIRIRRYRGFCRHNAEAEAAAAEMVAKRPALLAVFADLPQLDENARRKALAYLGGFFGQTASAGAVAANLLKTCLAG